MTEVKEKFSFKESLSYLFLRNPVLVLGLVIGQLVAGCTTLKNGVALSVAFLFITVPALLFASVFGKKLPRFIAPVCYALLSAAMLTPAYFISSFLSATIFDSLGIYPALLAVSTVPIVYSSKYAEKQKPLHALLNAVCISGGFAFTALILGGARELFGNGSLWGTKLIEATFPAVKLPFWGFILLGFMAAIVNLIKDLVQKPHKKEESI